MQLNYENIINELQQFVDLLVSQDRKPHVLGVVDFCKRLAKRYSLDENKLTIMALVHDLFRDIPGNKLFKIAYSYELSISELGAKRPILIHGLVASEYLKRRFGIDDEDMLIGIAYHTSGYPTFGPLGKALVLADSLELTRVYDKINQLREIAFYDLDVAYVEIIRNKINYAVNHNLYLLPETVETWNKLMEGDKA